MVRLYIVIGFLLCYVFSSGDLIAQLDAPKAESQYYQIKKVPIPDQVILEVGGLAFNDQGELAVSTRRGEIWEIANPSSAKPSFTRFAHGLHEPLGLAFRNGTYYLSQRGELTKINDTDGDGKADLYEPIYIWPLAGNYHEYSYGPKFLPNGDMLVTLNLGWIGRGASLSKWRGWMLKINPEGAMTPIATGMRSPAGFNLNEKGDIFYAENQGDWVGSGRMTHVEEGDFVGNPEGLKWTHLPGSPIKLTVDDIQDSLGYTLFEYAKVHPEIKPPSVWFPHTLMGISTSDILILDSSHSFGPFEGQMLVGDQGHSKLMRVFQEEIDGVYQGICFPFVSGFSSGILRLEWGPDNSIYAGMTSRGWSSTGREPYGLERLVWSGKTPFEMKAVRAMSDGFEIEFTTPVDRGAAANPASYSITDFTYRYHHIYGSPPMETETRTIYKVEVSQDGLKSRLYVEGLREGFVNEIKAEGIRSSAGKNLLHSTGYYTLNVIPGGGNHSAHTSSNAASGTQSGVSAKRVSKMPADWADGPDQIITLGTQPGLKYDISEIQVPAGSKIKLTFNNNDDMLHNLIITRPGQASKVGEMAVQMGLIGEEKGYVPDNDAVITHTVLLQPNTSDNIYFIAPEEPGVYEYVCTFPGHYLSMRGVIRVK